MSSLLTQIQLTHPYLYKAFSALADGEQHLHHIKALPLKIRLINFAYFYEKESRLITAGIDGCCMFDFQFICKYEPKQAMMLDPDGRNITFKLERVAQLPMMDEWVKGLKLDVANNLIIAWDQESVCFY